MRRNKNSQPSKYHKTRVIGFFSAWVAALVLSVSWNSLTPDPDLRIPFLPVVDISINGRELPPLRPSGPPVDRSEFIGELQELIGSAASASRTIYADRTYQAINHTDAVRMIRWMQDFYFNTPTLRYYPESYDCDNFARTFVVLGDLAGIPDHDWQGQLMFFRIYVSQQVSWAGVPAGGGHALVIFRSDRGWFAYEPQNGTTIELARYPNRRHVFALLTD